MELFSIEAEKEERKMVRRNSGRKQEEEEVEEKGRTVRIRNRRR